MHSRDSSRSSNSMTSSQNSGDVATDPIENARGHTLSEKEKRLIDWNVDVLFRLLNQIIANRGSSTVDGCDCFDESLDSEKEKNPFDEVKEIISLPQVKSGRNEQHVSQLQASETVRAQLRRYVADIAAMYNNNNKFHNFEHVRFLAGTVNS
jgi:hypothetical protein